jgi:hypothetical protein
MENKTIYGKIFEAKKEIGKISKDSSNPFFNSKYFDINSLLEHVEPILRSHGLLVLQPIVEGCVCTQIIDVETNEVVSSAVKLTSTDPQKVGSEITYFRRYTLQSILSLQAEDDDANTASSKGSAPASQAPKAEDNRPWLNDSTEEFIKAIEYVSGKGEKSIKEIEKKYKLSKVMREKLSFASNK